MIQAFFLAATDDNTITVNLWTVLIVLAIIALLVFIFRNVRR
jgi:hypothetical protein